MAKATAVTRAANSFELIAREWLERQRWAETYRSRVLRRLESHLFPWLGGLAVEDLTPPLILSCLRRVEETGAIETAHRELRCVGQILRYAVATGRLTSDPTRDLKGALETPQASHFAAVTEPQELAVLLRQLDAYQGSLPVRSALLLAPLVFVRPGELRQARWQDIDLDAAEWRFVASKTQQQHVVPLSRQAVSILRDLQPVTGAGEFVFPGFRNRKRAMSDSAVLAALRTMGIGKEVMSGHGFRATARTLLDEALGFAPHLIEHQLAHSVRDPLGRSYNRTQHLPERRAMMQRWSDYLDELRAGAKVVQLRA